MCPICLGTMIVNGIMWIAGSVGLVKVGMYIKKRYYLTFGKKCQKCKDRECCNNETHQ